MGKFQAQEPSARPQRAIGFAQRFRLVGHIAQAEGDRIGVELHLADRQRFGVARNPVDAPRVRGREYRGSIARSRPAESISGVRSQIVTAACGARSRIPEGDVPGAAGDIEKALARPLDRASRSSPFSRGDGCRPTSSRSSGRSARRPREKTARTSSVFCAASTRRKPNQLSPGPVFGSCSMGPDNSGIALRWLGSQDAPGPHAPDTSWRRRGLSALGSCAPKD